MERSSPSHVQWCDLPDELLGIVSSKVTSVCGRIRFSAVCKSWRAAMSLHPAPPVLPLLFLWPRHWRLDDTVNASLYCPEDGSVLRVPLPSRLSSMCFKGSYDGGWIATGSTVRLSPIMIMNVFSGAEVTLSEKQRRMSCPRPTGPNIISKIIFSDAPTSSSCILAVTTSGFNIALCRIGCPEVGWTFAGYDMESLQDIMFFRGDIYGLTSYSERLFRYDIGVDDGGAPVVTAIHQLDVQRREGPRSMSMNPLDYSAYIFELCGKLAMAVNTVWTQNGRRFFRVYELVDAGSDDGPHNYKWLEVHTLGDYALFLGPKRSSKVVHVPTGGRGGIEKNHIYYSNNYSTRDKQAEEFDEKSCVIRSSVDGDKMYFKEDQSIGDGDGDIVRIPSVGYYVIDGPDVPMWCFPPAL